MMNLNQLLPASLERNSLHFSDGLRGMSVLSGVARLKPISSQNALKQSACSKAD